MPKKVPSKRLSSTTHAVTLSNLSAARSLMKLVATFRKTRPRTDHAVGAHHEHLVLAPASSTGAPSPTSSTRRSTTTSCVRYVPARMTIRSPGGGPRAPRSPRRCRAPTAHHQLRRQRRRAEREQRRARASSRGALPRLVPVSTVPPISCCSEATCAPSCARREPAAHGRAQRVAVDEAHLGRRIQLLGFEVDVEVGPRPRGRARPYRRQGTPPGTRRRRRRRPCRSSSPAPRRSVGRRSSCDNARTGSLPYTIGLGPVPPQRGGHGERHEGRGEPVAGHAAARPAAAAERRRHSSSTATITGRPRGTRPTRPRPATTCVEVEQLACRRSAVAGRSCPGTGSPRSGSRLWP